MIGIIITFQNIGKKYRRNGHFEMITVSEFWVCTCMLYCTYTWFWWYTQCVEWFKV